MCISKPLYFLVPFLLIVLFPLIVESQDEESNVHGIPTAAEIAELPADGGPNHNRLIFEKSPYLLQHASNPVDWYPWGDEAFAKARAEDKPIFLSIGYSTCHWCHVMERESFQNDEVAALLNAQFIAIKVDREERPDIDQLFMSASVATRGGGGWPQTVLMTWDMKPFFLASYLPRESRPERLGVLDLLRQTREYWSANRDGLHKLADEILGKLNDFAANTPGKIDAEETLRKGFEQLVERYDPEFAGLGRKQKFPTTHHLSYLLRYWKRSGDPEALAMVESTLDAMHRGGMYDHIGHGFHRYAIDREWTTPHFEKMLYDQAMLAITYTEAYQATGEHAYAQVARNVLDYVLRDLTSPQGGFYSARDADSRGGEGLTYLWSVEELTKILGGEVGDICARAYSFEEDGNYLDQATDEKTGLNIPRPVREMDALARELSLSRNELDATLDAAREQLFEVRQKRPQPALDDKILTDWNGLMIAALAKAGRALQEPRYTQAALKAADFIAHELLTPSGELLHRYRLGDAAIPGLLDDYAYLAWGLLELYEATFDVPTLQRAIALNENMIAKFHDPIDGAFFLTTAEGTRLPIRLKEPRDGARPSGNSIAALNLLRIGRITGSESHEKMAHEVFSAFANKLRPSPSSFTQLLIALDFATGPSYEIVIAGDPKAQDTKEMLTALQTTFIPNAILLLRPDTLNDPPITQIAQFTQTQTTIDGHATAYICKNYVCNLPTTSPEVMLELLTPTVP